VKALITGGRGGIGSAIAAAYDGNVTQLDLPEFDVGDRDAWRTVEGEYEAAFLNAGVSIGVEDVAELSDEDFERIVRANFDGVVYGTRECAARLMPRGGSIVATASLAGLVGMPLDPIYTANKHAVVGLTRALGPALAAENVRFNAVCPGFVDTPLVEPLREGLAAAGLSLLGSEVVAETVVRLLAGGDTGECWFVQPGREPAPFRFPNVPGPRRAGATVGLPPIAS
jgi:NAD(P)-dependent dehydrogenase (short-subunit alcohol dehydrogenase family)